MEMERFCCFGGRGSQRHDRVHSDTARHASLSSSSFLLFLVACWGFRRFFWLHLLELGFLVQTSPTDNNLRC